MPRRASRRQFLQASALAGAGYWLGSSSASGSTRWRNERLQIAGIGVGGKGSSDIDQAGRFGDVVGLCDVDADFLNRKAERFKEAKKFADFREMLNAMGDKIDAVVVSTPDHTHAAASMMAMKMKKHVYCQKPLTHSVYEARQMRETAAKMGVCTQMGNQGTAESGLRRAVEVIQAGGIGTVREAHVWTNRPVWPQAPGIKARPEGEDPVPAYLNWECWLGPAPFRPYHHGPNKGKRGTYHDFNWRGWWDFGTGALGDMACHTANMAFMAMKLGYPTSVFAECGDLNPETYPAWAQVTFEFPARGDLPPAKFVWYEGRRNGKKVLPPEELLANVLKPNERLADSGSLIVGDKGILFSPNDYGASFRLCPEDDFKGFKDPEPTIPRHTSGDSDTNMKKEWVDAIKAGKPTVAVSNFDYAALLTETILLGNIAIRMNGQKLDWDGPNLKFTNQSSANQYLHREYRKGWTL